MKTTLAFTSFCAVSALALLHAWAALETACQNENLAALDRVAAFAAGKSPSMNFMDSARIESYAPYIHRKAMERANAQLKAGKMHIGFTAAR